MLYIVHLNCTEAELWFKWEICSATEKHRQKSVFFVKHAGQWTSLSSPSGEEATLQKVKANRVQGVHFIMIAQAAETGDPDLLANLSLQTPRFLSTNLIQRPLMAWHGKHESSKSCQSVRYMTVRGAAVAGLFTNSSDSFRWTQRNVYFVFLLFKRLNTVNVKGKEQT